MLNIYQAGPLFTEAEQSWHLSLKTKIEEYAEKYNYDVNVVWPYQLFSQEELDKSRDCASKFIFQACHDALESSHLVIALLDGPQVDDGTAWEIGFAYSQKKPILGIRTDFRQSGECSGTLVNAMVQQSCNEIFRTVESLLNNLPKYLSLKI